MKNILFFISLIVVFISCKTHENRIFFKKYDENQLIERQQEHEIRRMKFKLIQSKYLDMNSVFVSLNKDLSKFTEQEYQKLKPFILEKDIPSIQEAVSNGILSYEKIVLFYLYRIRKFESDSLLSLNSIIALNPSIVKEAREKDKNRPKDVTNSLYGLPILLKDNINTKGMPTTAGAFILEQNKVTDDAFIVKKLKENGALILGKVNLSEWAYYLCSGCPVGYSAIGGQTLNPYGIRKFETGGSSSGSGVAVAANFAIAAVGTETSGSILSPSSKNSVVGLKPTVGLLSRSGIVPISSTLDTPGPISKNVIDNAIFLSAMIGEDKDDETTNINTKQVDYLSELANSDLKGKRLGVFNQLLKDSIYKATVELLKDAGAEIIEFEPPKSTLIGFNTLLNIDMKNDLPKYLKNYADKNIEVKSVSDITIFNLQDSIARIPYGQQLFTGIVNDTTSTNSFEKIKHNLHETGRNYFNTPIDMYKLDAVLSINNNHAGFAAVAQYPCLTVPMGYSKQGEPTGITFIAKPFEEKKLLQLGYAFEQLTKVRKMPMNYY
ncbi:MAG: amidase family protein [Flavobacteriaceae bacterium]|nr:amidase family protein [Flavobacteriaceae bacterium]